MKKYVVTIIIVCIIIIVSFIGYYVYSKEDFNSQPNLLEDKAKEELSYLDTSIIAMLNSFNQISYANYKVVEKKLPNSSSEESSSSGSSEQEGGQDKKQSSNSITHMSSVPNSILNNQDKELNWENLKAEIEKMYATWTSILLDLNALEVKNENLLKFHTILDETTQAIEKKERKKAITKLAELYGLLPLYMEDYSSDEKEIHLYKTKSNVLYAYALIEYDGKEKEIKKYLSNAKNEFSYLMNISVDNSLDMISINKSYVLLNEIEKDFDIKEKKIFYIHYKNLMQELEVI